MPLNIIHRDVTHSNILLSFTGNVKLADFGIAKARIQESREKPGMLKGKMSYMAPEMLKGKSIDHRVDIFSLGVVLFELLTMQKLFKGENEDDVIRKIVYGDIGRTLMDFSTIHDDLQEILKKTLAQEADERYSSAQEFYADLNDFIFNNGIQISPHEFSEFICGLVKERSSAEGPEGSKPSSITDVTPSNISEIFKVESTIRERLNIDLSVMERFKPGSEVRAGANRPTMPPNKEPEEKPAYSGDIGELLVPRLISRLAVNRVTGRLKITAGESTRTVFMEKGNIASVHSKLAEDSLEKFLIEHSSLQLEEIEEAARSQQGDSVLRQFFNLGKITREEMEAVAVMAYGSRLTSLVTARGGRYEFFKASKDSNRLLEKPLPVFPLLSSSVRGGFEYEDYIQALGRYLTHRVKRVENMKLPLESIALEPYELDLMKIILTDMNLRDIFETTKDMEHKKMIACVIYLLYQYELIKFR
ncbi:MAG: protein kinase [Pseudomonadota bacterium]